MRKPMVIHRRWIFLSVLILNLSNPLFAQKKLQLHTGSVEYLLAWMNTGCATQNIDSLLSYPSVSFMEQLLKFNKKNAPDFKTVLKDFDCQKSNQPDEYLLHKAFENRDEINQLLQAVKNLSFANEVQDRVYAYFPNQLDTAGCYPVFFTATGWEYGDAMTFSYTIENNQYKIGETGTPAIIFNLTLVNTLYGDRVEQQIKTFKDIMSHELFHAVLSDYNKSSLFWDQSILENNALYLLFNEGMAHYISDQERLIKNYDSDKQYKEKEHRAFAMLNDSLAIAFNQSVEQEKRVSAVSYGLFGSYWQKYICISGMFMAYHIERGYGKQELIRCVQKGPQYFLEKYLALTDIDQNLSIAYPLKRYFSNIRN